MNFNDLWLTTEAQAQAKGLYHFEITMSKDRARLLFHGLLDSRKSFKWMETHFVDFIISVSAREHRRQNLFPLGDRFAPVCGDDCKWRRPAESLPPQRNALRIEVFSPSPKCGFSLKEGRIGGHDDDYNYCTHSLNKDKDKDIDFHSRLAAKMMERAKAKLKNIGEK